MEIDRFKAQAQRLAREHSFLSSPIESLIAFYLDAGETQPTIIGSPRRADVTKFLIQEIVARVLDKIPTSIGQRILTHSDLRELTRDLRSTIFLQQLRSHDDVIAVTLLCELVLEYFGYEPRDLPSIPFPVPGPLPEFKKCAACWRFFEATDSRRKYCTKHMRDRNDRDRNIRRLRSGIAKPISLIQPSPQIGPMTNVPAMFQSWVQDRLVDLNMLDIDVDSHECSTYLAVRFLLDGEELFFEALSSYSILNSPTRFTRESPLSGRLVEIKNLLADGTSQAAIARNLGVTRAAISIALKRTDA